MPHSAKLFAAAFRILQRADEAEDVVQDVMVKLWQMRDDLPPDDALLPLALRVTRNLAIDRYRSRHMADSDWDDGTVAVEEAEPDNTVDDHDRLQHMMRLIGLLPPDQQRVLRLRAFDDFTTGQIARMTGLSEDNVRQLLSRARRHLRDMANKQGVL